MKTTATITWKTPIYVLIGFLSLILTSCSSYQNSSYYDRDGIYSTTESKNVVDNNQPTASSIQYKQYFESLQNTSASDDEIFTDVNSYSSNGYNDENDSIQAPSIGYASWGSSPQQTTVTVYPSSYWSVGFGYPYYDYSYPYYGYGYPYYGLGYSGYGWGYSGYGWGGYPGYGGGYLGYGYSRPIATAYIYNNNRNIYNNNRRGSSYGGGYANRATPYNRNGISDRSSFTNRNTGRNRNSVYNNSNRSSGNTIVDRKVPTFTNRNSSSTSRNSSSTSTSRNYSQSQSRNNSNYNQNRTNTSTQRPSYTPSNSSNRSSGSSSSSGGGGRTSGGGGGGRTGGGGRR